MPGPGEIFDDKFELIELLGTGGIGSVFKARQLDVNRIVALKILHQDFSTDENLHARFLQEAKALSQLSHANIVTVYHLGLSNDQQLYMAMEYIQGKSLQEVLNQARMPLEQCIEIMRTVTQALDYLHSRNIVHRDLKPANIVLTDFPEKNTAKIIDFGMIRQVENNTKQKLTRTDALLGTPHYMSPEQCSGKPADLRSDIYSLTICFYEMLVGARPFEADNAIGFMYKHLNENIPELQAKDFGALTPSLNAIIRRGSAKAPDQRYQSMKAMREDLNALDLSSFSATTGGANALPLNRFSTISLVLLFIIGTFACCTYFSWHKPQSTQLETLHPYMKLTSEGLASKAFELRNNDRAVLFYARSYELLLAKKVRTTFQRSIDEEIWRYSDILLNAGFPEKCFQITSKQLASKNTKHERDASALGDDSYYRNSLYVQLSQCQALHALGHDKQAKAAFNQALLFANMHHADISPGNKIEIAYVATILDCNASQTESALSLASSVLDCDNLASELRTLGGQKQIKYIVKRGRSFVTNTPLSFDVKAELGFNSVSSATDLASLATSEAYLHIDENDMVAARKCLAEAKSYLRQKCTDRERAYFEDLSIALAISGENEALFDLLALTIPKADIPLKLPSHMSGDELLAKVKTVESAQAVQLFKYIVTSKNLNDSTKLALIFEGALYAKDSRIPMFLKRCLACIAYDLAQRNPQVPLFMKTGSLREFAFANFFAGVPSKAVEYFTLCRSEIGQLRQLDEHSQKNVASRYSEDECNIYLAKSYLQLKNKAKAIETIRLLKTPENKEDTTWMFQGEAELFTATEQTDMLSKLVESCQSFYFLPSIAQECRKKHLLEQAMHCVTAESKLAQKQSDANASFAANALAAIDKTEIMIEANSQPDELKTQIKSLEAMTPKIIQVATATKNIFVLRQLESALALSGSFNLGFWVNEKADHLERLMRNETK